MVNGRQTIGQCSKLKAQATIFCRQVDINGTGKHIIYDAVKLRPCAQGVNFFNPPAFCPEALKCQGGRFCHCVIGFATETEMICHCCAPTKSQPMMMMMMMMAGIAFLCSKVTLVSLVTCPFLFAIRARMCLLEVSPLLRNVGWNYVL